jgi:hypothetical protein
LVEDRFCHSALLVDEVCGRGSRRGTDVVGLMSERHAKSTTYRGLIALELQLASIANQPYEQTGHYTIADD